MWRLLETITTKQKDKILRDMMMDAEDREWKSSLRIICTSEEVVMFERERASIMKDLFEADAFFFFKCKSPRDANQKGLLNSRGGGRGRNNGGRPIPAL